MYEVIVSNVGTVCTTRNKRDATSIYRDYVRMSKSGLGRVGGEDVTLCADSEPIREYEGTLSKLGYQYSEFTEPIY